MKTIYPPANPVVQITALKVSAHFETLSGGRMSIRIRQSISGASRLAIIGLWIIKNGPSICPSLVLYSPYSLTEEL